MNKKRKKYTLYLVAGVILLLLGVFMNSQRQKSLAKATSGKLQDLPRSREAVDSDFYTSQLTEKEAEIYQFLVTKMENLQGGVVTLPRPVNGTEYMRIITALENEGYNHFYGLYEVPMTEENVYVKYVKQDIMDITQDSISKVILFLSCAEGIDRKGDYAKDGTVQNLEKVDEGLSVITEKEADNIRKLQDETELTLSNIMQELPGEYGEKSTIDYFLNWMDEHMTFASELAQDAGTVSNMSEMFRTIYKYNHLSAAAERKGSALGYAKVLSELCRRAGMESHIVLGKWKGSWISSESYVLCAIKMNNQTIYVDASGAKSSILGGERYLTEQEAMNHMEFVSYFDYT